MTKILDAAVGLTLGSVIAGWIVWNMFGPVGPFLVACGLFAVFAEAGPGV